MAKKSGPRMKGGSYYSKGKKRGRPRKPRRDTLTLTEKKQVRNIAKTVVKNTAESKYFNTTALNLLKRLTPLQSRPGVVNNSVLAFAVGNPSSVGGYGGSAAAQALISLNMAKLFTVAATAPLNNNVIEGSKCMPSLMKTEWTINYPQINSSANSTGGSPIYVRFIRVKPKNLKFSDVDYEPKSDLFRDQYNVETGITAATFNDMELQEYALNRRKYTVLQDSSKVLYPTSTYGDLAVTPGVTTSLVDNLGNMSNWRFSVNHKPNEKTYYYNNDPQAVGGDQFPQAGQSSEMIFIHFCNLGINGSALQKGDEIRVTCKPCATFKDI